MPTTGLTQALCIVDLGVEREEETMVQSPTRVTVQLTRWWEVRAAHLETCWEQYMHWHSMLHTRVVRRVWVSGVVQTVLYLDFFYYYIKWCVIAIPVRIVTTNLILVDAGSKLDGTKLALPQ